MQRLEWGVIKVRAVWQRKLKNFRSQHAQKKRKRLHRVVNNLIRSEGRKYVHQENSTKENCSAVKSNRKDGRRPRAG